MTATDTPVVVAAPTPPPLRLFVADDGAPRARRTTDAVVLVAGTIVLALMGAAHAPTPAILDALIAFFAAWPPMLTSAWALVADLVPLLALVVLLAATVRRRPLVLDFVLAVVAALVVWALAARLVGGAWPEAWPTLRRAADDAGYPAARLSLGAAVVLTARPHLTRPFRRLTSWVLALGAIAAAVVGGAPIGVAAGLVVGAVSAAVVHLLLGTTAGRPSPTDVQAALAELGVATGPVAVLDRQRSGAFAVTTTDPDGGRLVVEVHGRDAHDTALVATLGRAVWLRVPGTAPRLGRERLVEHQALITLLARQAGIPGATVERAATTAAGDALLVQRPVGDDAATLGRVPGGPASLWSRLARLHGAGLVHGGVDGTTVVDAEGTAGLDGFAAGAITTDPSRQSFDLVQALVTVAVLHGPDEALASAHAALGGSGLAELLPLLQEPSLTAWQHQAARTSGLDLAQLRRRAAETCGVEEPALQQLRRVTIGAVLRLFLPLLAGVILVAGLGRLDWDRLFEELRSAAWWLVAIGFVMAQLPRFAQAVTTLGASPVPLPLRSAYAMQLATSYVNVAVPTTAARVALSVRFFQRHGVKPTAALTAGALDGFCGFLVQIGLALVLVLLTPVSLGLGFDVPTDGVVRVGAYVVGAVVVSVLVVASVGRLRRRVVHGVRIAVEQATGVLRNLRSPRRLLMLFGGHMSAEVLWAVALGVFLLALGQHVPLLEILLVNITVGMVAGLLPVPGGIGVVEGGLMVGLVAAGVPEEAAFAAAILHRIASFYLPPIWGFFALRWLQRTGQV